MKSRLSMIVLAMVLILALCGCSKSPEQAPPPKAVAEDEAVNLDKVLDVFSGTLEKLDLEKIANATNKEIDAMAARPDTPIEENIVPVNKLDEANDRHFVNAFTRDLNRAKIYPGHIGVAILPSGAIQGFIDRNRNKRKDGDKESELFLIQLDRDRGRLIASDTRNQIYRDLSYGYVPRGLFTAYLLGSMLNRQRATGFDDTEFEAIEIAPKGYYKTARSDKGGKGKSQAGQKGTAKKSATR